MARNSGWRATGVEAGAAVLLCSMIGGAAVGQTTTTYGYDALGRLNTTTYSTGDSATYVYDAAGNRTLVTSISSAPDTMPDPLYLGGPITDATPSTWYASSNRVITGINVAAPVSISGGEYRINGTGWETAPGTVSAGENFQVRVRALATPGATRTATVTVGGLTDTFKVTTAD